MPRAIAPALIVHGGAGARGLAEDQPERKRCMLIAARKGADILRRGGTALNAVVAAVMTLEDHPLFNAGTGSLLTTDGTVEMDASVMVATPRQNRDAADSLSAGAVAAVSKVRNPILLAQAVMRLTPHVMLVGEGADRFARQAGIALCRNQDLITARARQQWLARRNQAERDAHASGHGTVGAAAVDCRGEIAAATSTGGYRGKLPGRVGDSAIVGAGTFADGSGGASATGHGEAIIIKGLCREAVRLMGVRDPSSIALQVIRELIAPRGVEAGIILVDRRGRIGYAHNADAMHVAIFQGSDIRHLKVRPCLSHPRP